MTSPMAIAENLLGMGEVPNRAQLRDFMETGGANLDPVTAAWCAAFVNASLGHAGVEGTGKLNARSFLDWGQPVEQPRRGDVAVFSRGDPNGWQGHVGFFDGYNEDGTIRVLGGNQGDAVSYANYSPNALLGFRRAPDGSPMPENALAEQAPAPEPVNALAIPRFMATHDPADFMSRRRFG
jgi:uncharacterized protein (TIGR02594 family)